MVAAHLGTLDSKIAAYRADPQNAPALDVLRDASRQIFEAGDKRSARKVLEFVFEREIDEHNLVAANFLGLAEIRIAAGDVPAAVELLRRLVIVVGKPYENLDPAAALLEKTGHNAEAIEFLEPLVKSAPWEPDYRLRLAEAKIAAGQEAKSARETLAAIASSTDSSYATRVEAAKALAGTHQPAELGSAELNLLAGGAGITVAAADLPYFYEARLKASQKVTDPNARLHILENAVGDIPASEEARIPLFQAAVATQADEFALGALEPLLSREFLGTPPATPNVEQEIISSETEEAPEETTESDEEYAPVKLRPAQKAQMAWAIAGVLERLNRQNEALPYLQLARKLEKAPDRRKAIRVKIADIQSLLRRQRLNAARQPILHEALEQDRVVRPRLLARAAPAAKVGKQGGVKK